MMQHHTNTPFTGYPCCFMPCFKTRQQFSDSVSLNHPALHTSSNMSLASLVHSMALQDMHKQKTTKVCLNMAVPLLPVTAGEQQHKRCCRCVFRCLYVLGLEVVMDALAETCTLPMKVANDCWHRLSVCLHQINKSMFYNGHRHS